MSTDVIPSVENPLSQKEFLYTAPLGKNSVSSLYVLHSDRKYYENIIIPVIKSTYGINSFGNLLKIDSLYGLVDEQYNIVTPRLEFFKSIPSANEQNKKVMNFVADAFNDLNSYITTAAMIGKVDKSSIFVNLRCHNDFIQIDKIINKEQTNKIQNFISFARSDNQIFSYIKDEKSFNKKFINYLKGRIINNSPVTKAGIVLSTNLFNQISGLVIDIAKDKADNDTVKFNTYLKNPDFSFFADACSRFGFKIDQNIPWRIYADLASPAMKDYNDSHIGYMVRNNIKDVSYLFKTRYDNVLSEEIDFLKNFFYNSYSTFINDNPYYELNYKTLTVCDMINKNHIKQRNLIPREQYYKLFPDTYWLKIYTYFKNYETRTNLKQQQFDNIVREANKFINAGDRSTAMRYVTKYFSSINNITYFSSLRQRGKVVQDKADNTGYHELIL